MRLPPRSLSLSPSISLPHSTPSSRPPLLLYLTLSRSPRSLFWFISLSPSLRPPAISSLLLFCFLLFIPILSPHVFHFLSLALCFSPSLPYLPCRCLVSLVPFKARQMERQALSPSSGPNDLFLTMGPNGPQIINDEGSMER